MSRADGVDVIVVGGGAAGCVVAARLAELGSPSVLLLEAGPDPRGDLAGGLRDGWGMTRDFDWGFTSEPDALGTVQNLRRVKLLGGTSWVTRFALRGSPADFDAWAARGNPGWAFDDVLPAFIRLETDLDFGHEPWHGDQGPIPIGRYADLEPSPIAAAVVQALQDDGFPEVDDHNRPGAIGVGRMPMSSRNGVRVSTLLGYLSEDRTGTNLVVRTDAQVADVAFEGTRATGVRLADGSVIHADTVVLSAGTYGSPCLLLRSGVGPPEHLGSVGLPVRVALTGVGENLMDHPGVDVDCGSVVPQGPPVLHSVATFRSSMTAADGAPDLMFWIADPEPSDEPTFTIDIVLLEPRSRGSVRLRSLDPAEAPRIELPGVREDADVERLVEGYRRGWEIADRPKVRRLSAGPPPAVDDADALAREIRRNAYSVPHVVGTCAMGPSPDDGAVVDPSCRVHGTSQLYVADASIIPIPPSGFPHLPTIMIGERFAEQLAVTR